MARIFKLIRHAMPYTVTIQWPGETDGFEEQEPERVEILGREYRLVGAYERIMSHGAPKLRRPTLKMINRWSWEELTEGDVSEDRVRFWLYNDGCSPGPGPNGTAYIERLKSFGDWMERHNFREVT